MRYSHLATRLFGAPLLMERGKLETIVAVFGQRAGVEVHVNGPAPAAPEPKAYGPGDEGKNRKAYYVTGDGIAVIDVVGPLVKRSSGDFLSGGPTTYGEVETEFMDAVNDASIKGILLCIDSPGGETTGCFELADTMFAQRGKKPVYAAADGDAFSAAYAIASAADRVFVTKSGGVGSVGVWMAHVDQSGFDKELGVKVTYIFAGARKIDGNPHEPLSEDAYKVFKAEVDRVYEMFVGTVSRNRAMDAAAVRSTEAGLFFGDGGVGIGFADQVGTVGEALVALTAAVQTSSAAVGSAGAKERKRMEDQAAGPNYATAREIVGWCAVKNMSARQALAYLTPDATVASVQQKLLEAGVQGSGPEIQSHIAPDAGTGASANVEDSPVVKAARARAAAQQGGTR